MGRNICSPSVCIFTIICTGAAAVTKISQRSCQDNVIGKLLLKLPRRAIAYFYHPGVAYSNVDCPSVDCPS